MTAGVFIPRAAKGLTISCDSLSLLFGSSSSLVRSYFVAWCGRSVLLTCSLAFGPLVCGLCHGFYWRSFLFCSIQPVGQPVFNTARSPYHFGTYSLCGWL